MYKYSFLCRWACGRMHTVIFRGHLAPKNIQVLIGQIEWFSMKKYLFLGRPSGGDIGGDLKAPGAVASVLTRPSSATSFAVWSNSACFAWASRFNSCEVVRLMVFVILNLCIFVSSYLSFFMFLCYLSLELLLLWVVVGEVVDNDGDGKGHYQDTTHSTAGPDTLRVKLKRFRFFRVISSLFSVQIPEKVRKSPWIKPKTFPKKKRNHGCRK